MSRLKDENLEQDLLIEYSSRSLHFYRRNKVAVISGGIGLVLVIGLIIGYFIYSSQQEEEAQMLLSSAEQYLMQGDYQRALYGDDQELTLGFTQLADNYRRTDAGNLANYYAAIAEYEMENYEEALQYIERFNVPDGIIGVGPLSLHAVILSELGEHEQAARMFLRAADWNDNEATTPYNLLEAALAFREAGMNEQAIEQLDKIINQYSGSQQVDQAQRLKGLLAVR
ncbi:MAG: tetratricopeptide repeat protein [Balneolaceae bacterium]